MQKPDWTCRQVWETNLRRAELASQPGSLQCSSESLSPHSHVGRSCHSIFGYNFCHLLTNFQTSFIDGLTGKFQQSYNKISHFQTVHYLVKHQCQKTALILYLSIPDKVAQQCYLGVVKSLTITSLQIYCQVCFERIRNIDQHLAKLWITKFISSTLQQLC